VGEKLSAIPSSADLFRQIGENLGITIKKIGIPLDAIVYYVERTADFNDLNSMWNWSKPLKLEWLVGRLT